MVLQDYFNMNWGIKSAESMRRRVANMAKKSGSWISLRSQGNHPVRDVYLEPLCSHVVSAKYGLCEKIVILT